MAPFLSSGHDLGKNLENIVMLKSGKSQGCVLTIVKAPKSTVAGIWKQHEKIECYVSSSDCPVLAKKSCIVREGQFEKLDRVCFTWSMQQHFKDARVSIAS